MKFFPVSKCLFFKVIITCLAFFLPNSTPLPARAIEPATVATVASVAVSLMKKDPGNPSTDVLLANRKLLIAIHERLDAIETGIAEILKEVSGIDQKIVLGSLKATELNLGSRIRAYGVTYSNELKDLYEVRDSGTADEYSYQLILFKGYVNNLLQEFPTIHQDFRSRDGSLGTGAATQIVAAYVELAARIERLRLYGGSPIPTINAANRHLAVLQEMLDPSIKGSLADLINQLETQIPKISSDLGYDVSLARNEVNVLRGSLSGPCITKYITPPEVLGLVGILVIDTTATPETSARWSIEAKNLEETGSRISYKLSVSLSNWTQVIPGCSPIASPDEIRRGNRAGLTTHFPVGHRTLAEARRTEEASALRISNLLDVFVTLLELQEAVKQAIPPIKKISSGDFGDIDYSAFIQLGSTSLADLSVKMIEYELEEAQVDAEAYSYALQKKREQIRALIRDQDERIAESFQKAANAAKTNATLGLIQTGATALSKYFQGQVDAAKLDELEGVLKSVSDKLSASPDRGPAGENLAKGLNAIGGLITWFVSVENTKTQLTRMNESREKIETAMQKGTSREYLVLLKGDKFFMYTPADEPQLFGADVQIGGRVTISGR